MKLPNSKLHSLLLYFEFDIEIFDAYVVYRKDHLEVLCYTDGNDIHYFDSTTFKEIDSYLLFQTFQKDLSNQALLATTKELSELELLPAQRSTFNNTISKYYKIKRNGGNYFSLLLQQEILPLYDQRITNLFLKATKSFLNNNPGFFTREKLTDDLLFGIDLSPKHVLPFKFYRLSRAASIRQIGIDTGNLSLLAEAVQLLISRAFHALTFYHESGFLHTCILVQDLKSTLKQLNTLNHQLFKALGRGEASTTEPSSSFHMQQIDIEREGHLLRLSIPLYLQFSTLLAGFLQQYMSNKLSIHAC